MKVNSGQAPSTLIPEYLGSDFDKVITVADNIETVTEVADNLDHIKTVDNNLGIINTVLSNIDEIATTSSNIEDVKSVATNIDYINTVEGNIENIVTVADNITDVATVSDNIGYVKGVAEGIEGLPVISYIGDEPPTQPLNGAEWYCTTDGRSYVWYVDNDSGQWVESSPQSDTVVADSAIAQHEAKDGVHAISGVAGLQATLDEKYSPNNKPSAADVGATPPTEPKIGSIWYCTTDGRSYVWYENTDSGQWVDSSPQSNSL